MWDEGNYKYRRSFEPYLTKKNDSDEERYREQSVRYNPLIPAVVEEMSKNNFMFEEKKKNLKNNEKSKSASILLEMKKKQNKTGTAARIKTVHRLFVCGKNEKRKSESAVSPRESISRNPIFQLQSHPHKVRSNTAEGRLETEKKTSSVPEEKKESVPPIRRPENTQYVAMPSFEKLDSLGLD